MTRTSFDLDGDEPTMTVAAGYSKRRRQGTLPLRPDAAVGLRAFFEPKLPTAQAFNLPTSDKTAAMFRKSLQAARQAWIDNPTTSAERKRRENSSFSAYRDDADRVTDFHSLRYTFITNRARGGVHPKDAQALARHSTITFAMDRYSHVARRVLRKALDALPDLSGRECQAGRATGTDSATPEGRATGGHTGGNRARLGASGLTSMRGDSDETASTSCA